MSNILLMHKSIVFIWAASIRNNIINWKHNGGDSAQVFHILQWPIGGLSMS